MSIPHILKSRFLQIIVLICYVFIFLLLEYHYAGELLNNDAYSYLSDARIAQQHGLVHLYHDSNANVAWHHTPPMLYFCMLVLHKFFALSLENAGLLCNWLPVILSAIGILFICRVLYKNDILAFGTIMLIMSIPEWYKDANGILRDPLYWCEAIWFLYLALRLNVVRDNIRGNYISLILCGTLAGLMMLTRKEAITIVIPLFILSLVNLTDSWRIWQLPKKHIIPLITSIVFAGFIALLPWLCGIDFIPMRGVFDQ